jgi:anti-sigma B factor antagonist
MNFAVERTVGSVRACVAVAGEVDACTAPDLLAALLEAVEVDPRLTVDLSAVTFMDSQGLTALLRARQEAEHRGGTIRLEGVPPRVLKLLHLASMDTVFTIDPAPAERSAAG